MGKLSRLKTQGQRNKTSKGEKDVYDLLKKMFPTGKIYTEYPLHNIIPDCNNNNLRVDIWFQTFNMIFEFDGAGHFIPLAFSTEEEAVFAAKEALVAQQQRDNYKNMLCREAGVKLIRIDHRIWDTIKTAEKKREFLWELIQEAGSNE